MYKFDTFKFVGVLKNVYEKRKEKKNRLEKGFKQVNIYDIFY